MAPSFFLKQFGISTVSNDDENSGDTILVNEPKTTKKTPKISPLGFEIFEDEDVSSAVGLSVYVKINGDADNPSSAWETIEKDDDGDLAVDIDIDDAVMALQVYVKIGTNLVKVPDDKKRIDNDGDIQINATDLFLSGMKLSNMMVKLDEPNPMPPNWQVGKFVFDTYGGMHYKTATGWEAMLMPVDDAFVTGYYVFK